MVVIPSDASSQVTTTFNELNAKSGRVSGISDGFQTR